MTTQRPTRGDGPPDDADDIGRIVPPDTEPKLKAYVATQQRVANLRRRGQLDLVGHGARPPWPELGNPMLEHLLDRARAIADHDGVEQAFVWLAAHAWFEGGIDYANRAVRQITGDL